MQKKRIFAAIDISDEARQRVASYIESFRHDFENAPVRWEKPEKLHITIKFLGNVDENELASFTAQIETAASQIAPFEITIVGTGAFIKRSSRANVLWLGLKSEFPNGAQKVIEFVAAVIANESRQRRFNPHLTIARLKDAKKAHDVIERHFNETFETVTFDVKEITIYESTLLPEGSTYSVLSRHKLNLRAEMRV